MSTQGYSVTSNSPILDQEIDNVMDIYYNVRTLVHYGKFPELPVAYVKYQPIKQGSVLLSALPDSPGSNPGWRMETG
jgi:hypothetical protein